MPSIVAFQLKQIFYENLIFFSKWHVYKQPVTLKSVISAFIILQPIKDVIANGHDKLNRLMIAQTPWLISDKNYLNWLMKVEYIASKISVIFSIQHNWRDQISGFHVSPGSAETLARGGGITNHHLIVYSLSNISVKKLPKSVNVRWSYSVRWGKEAYSSLCYKHHTATLTHVPYGITQCYLPPGRNDIPAFTPANYGWYSI